MAVGLLLLLGGRDILGAGSVLEWVVALKLREEEMLAVGFALSGVERRGHSALTHLLEDSTESQHWKDGNFEDRGGSKGSGIEDHETRREPEHEPEPGQQTVPGPVYLAPHQNHALQTPDWWFGSGVVVLLWAVL
ncbi:hypothetical protein DL95DRAFT_410955 [Leptodontidium sp. 2 PMI_412]|nr:hypothetical protein DL95DRAFT_410955 [Leptodontidium sp. 2 PMI_412]